MDADNGRLSAPDAWGNQYVDHGEGHYTVYTPTGIFDVWWGKPVKLPIDQLKRGEHRKEQP